MADENKNKNKNTKAPKTTLHVLLTDVKIGGEVHKKGTKYPLTEKGVKFFKSKYYIK